MTPEKLMPCPFCLSPAHVKETVFVECTNEGCNMNGDAMYQISEWDSAKCWQQLRLAREGLEKIVTNEGWDGKTVHVSAARLNFIAKETLAKMGEIK